MRSKRLSLVVTGVLLLALVLFGSTAAQAQAVEEKVEKVTMVELTPLGYDEVLVGWMHAPDLAGIKEYEIGYIKTKTADVFGAASPPTVKVSVNLDQTLLDGLDAKSSYLIGVRAVPTSTTAVTNNRPSDWVFVDYQNTSATSPRVQTLDPPTPEGVFERDIEIAEGDMALLVEWEEPRPDSTKRSSTLTITEYEVAFAKKADGSDMKVWPFALTSAIVDLNGLMNATKYYVAVRSKNSAGGWSGYDWTQAAEGTPMAGAGTPTSTPALPLFGMLALGAGLVSAGRRRLRAQRLLKK